MEENQDGLCRTMVTYLLFHIAFSGFLDSH